MEKQHESQAMTQAEFRTLPDGEDFSEELEEHPSDEQSIGYTAEGVPFIGVLPMPLNS